MSKRIQLRTVLYSVLIVIIAVAVTSRVTGWVKESSRTLPQLTFEQVKQTEIPARSYQRYLILYQDQEAVADTANIKDNLQVAMQYGKLPTDVMSFSQWRDSAVNLDAYTQGAVIVIGENQSNLARTDRLEQYVSEQGGTLINAMRSTNSPLNLLYGITGTPQFIESPVNGLHWLARLYPGLSDHDLSPNRIQSSAMDVALDPGAQRWAEGVDSNKVPLLWLMERGRGHTLYWNTTALQEKMMRGLFVQALMKAQGTGVKMMIGAQVWFIDDFPAPAYDRASEGNETGMTDYKFRLKRFDPDMQTIASKYGIRYSTGVIFEYNQQAQPPFELHPRGASGRLYDLEMNIVKANGELGLHGYNHLPLKFSYTASETAEYGYPAWASEEAVRQALDEARKHWVSEVKTSYPTFYIPPSNVLSTEGKKILLERMPELRTISSIYVSNETFGAFEQEFLPDPDLPNLMGTPRITYGFELSEDELAELYSGIGSIGIVSHFNHPDDVFHSDRNEGRTWEQLRDGFESLVADVNQRFPWLKPLTATELSDELRLYHQAEVQVDRSQEGRIEAYVTPLAGPMYMEIRAADPAAWQARAGGQILDRNQEDGVLWVKVTEPHVVLEVTR